MSVVGETVVRVRAEAGGLIQQVEADGSRAGRAFAAAFNKSSAGAGKGVERELSQATRGAVAGSGAFGHLTRSVAFAGVTFLGTAKAVDVVKDSLHEAADEQKQLERGLALFKNAAAGVNEFAEGAATSLGQSHDEALKFTNDLGQMLVPLGIAPQKAAAMSVELDKLVGNLAAMRNEDPTTVLNKIEAGLRGRGMGLKAYGIQVDTATIKEEALRLGLVKQAADSGKVAAARQTLAIRTAQLQKAEQDYGVGTTQVATAQLGVAKAQGALDKAVAGTIPTLTQQQKSLAAVNLILQAGGRYSDEFGKHSGDLANKERILHAEIRNLEEGLGRGLLPEITKVTGGMADWFGKAENQAKVQKFVTDAVHETTAALHLAWDAFKVGVRVIKPLVDAVGGFGNALKLILAYKVASWVDATIVPAMRRAQVAWATTGAAATATATATTTATTVIARDMSVLANSSSTLAVKNQIAAIGTAAQVAEGKATLLRGGLGRLASVGKIAIPIALITTVTNSGGSPWSAAVQGGMLGLLFGGPEGAIAGAAASVALNVIVNYIKGSGSVTDPGPPMSRSGPAKVPIVQARGNANNVGYIRNVAREMWASGESRETIYNALVAAGYNPGIVAQAVIDATNDDQVNAARQKVLARNKQTAAAVIAAGVGGVANPVPGGGQIIGTPGVGTHNQSDWQSGNAIDVTVQKGSPILSPVDGQVVKISPFVDKHPSGTKWIYGASVTINGDGNIWFITHLAKVTVGLGPVKKGQQIGIAGSIGHVHIAVQSGSPMQIPGLVQGDKGGSNTLWQGGGGGATTTTTTPLVVGKKPPKPLFQVVSNRDDAALAAAQRDVTRAGVYGGGTLEAAINAEIAVDNKLIAAAKKAKASTAAQKKQVEDYIQQRKADIASLKAQLARMKQAEVAEQTRDAARLGKHDDLVDAVLSGLGIPKSGGGSRAADAVRAAYEAMSDTALRAVLAAQKKAKASLAKSVKTASADVTDAADVLRTLTGFDPKVAVTYTDKWGREFKLTIGQIVADAQKAMRDLQAALASGNKAAIDAAIAEWNKAKGELGAAVSAGFDAAAAVVQAKQDQFTRTFGHLSDRIMGAFDRETQRVLTGMQDQLQSQIDAVTKAGAELTKSEAALARLDAQHNAATAARANDQAIRSRDQAKQQLAALLRAGIGGINPATGQPITQADIQAASDAAVSAQASLDDELYQEQRDAVQKRADAERKARDEDTAARIKKLQDDEKAREQDYQDQRDALRQSLQDQLDDWEKHLLDKSKSWSDFTAWLAGEGASGDFGPNPIVAMTDAGQAQGSAFADAYIAELKRAYDAQQALVSGADPSAPAYPHQPIKDLLPPPAHPFGAGKGPQGFASGGEIPGIDTGRDSVLLWGRPGETIVDTSLTDALKRALLGGNGNRRGNDNAAVEELLRGLLLEMRRQTGLLESPTPLEVALHTPNPNQIALKAVR